MKKGIRHEARNTHDREKQSSFGCDAKKQKYRFIKLGICWTILKCMDKKNQLDVTFVFFISLLIVAQHVSGNHVPIIRI